jgi:phenylacetate-CoA ligase
LAEALHGALSRGVLLPLYGAYRELRPTYRPAHRATLGALRQREMLSALPAHERERWILTALRQSVRHAAANSAFYRQAFQSIGFDSRTDFSFADFARLPVLERDAVLDRADAIRVPSIPARLVRRDATGGSTGKPVVVWKGPAELGWIESGAQYFYRQIGVPPGSRTALLWGHHVDAEAGDNLSSRLLDFMYHRRWFDCFRLTPDVLDRYHRELTAYRPACLLSYASALGALAAHLDAGGVKATYPGTALITGAEKFPLHERESVWRVFAKPVHEQYGSRDVGLIGFQLDPSASLEFTVDWASIFVEPEGGDELSSILVTKLHADAFPMIRYRIGDVARFVPGSLPGHPALRLVEVVGRELERVYFDRDRWLHGTLFPHYLKDYPVRDFQIYQDPAGTVFARIVPAPAWNAAAQQRLETELRRILAPLELRLELVEQIARTGAGKRRPVISDFGRTTAREDHQ